MLALGGLFGAPGGALGDSVALLGVSWVALGRPLGALGTSLALVGVVWCDPADDDFTNLGRRGAKRYE